MVHDKWSLQRGQDSNSRPLGHESSPLPLDHGVLPKIFDCLLNAIKENLFNITYAVNDYEIVSVFNTRFIKKIILKSFMVRKKRLHLLISASTIAMKSITFHKFLVKPDTDTQKFLFVYQ